MHDVSFRVHDISHLCTDVLFAVALLASYVVYNYIKPGTGWLTGHVATLFGKDAAKIVKHGIKHVRLCVRMSDYV